VSRGWKVVFKQGLFNDIPGRTTLPSGGRVVRKSGGQTVRESEKVVGSIRRPTIAEKRPEKKVKTGGGRGASQGRPERTGRRDNSVGKRHAAREFSLKKSGERQ